MTRSALADDIRLFEGNADGPTLAIAFGTHGDERAPIDAGLELREHLDAGALKVGRGRLLLVLSNPRATAQDRRWSEGGVDLNRCFHADVLAGDPQRYEEGRAREIVDALESSGAEILVDFHCTVEPGSRFLMQHPPVDDGVHASVSQWLRAEVLLTDPGLQFGGVSLDEWMSTRDRVGVCYETGWSGSPDSSPAFVLEEMLNLLAGCGLIEGCARRHTGKTLLQLERSLVCAAEGFRWAPGVGENLQSLAAGTLLGRYGDGAELTLDEDATLIFPKKKPELLQVDKPLVLLASRR